MDLNRLTVHMVSQDISCNWPEKSHLLCALISSCPYFPESIFQIPTAWKILLLLCWLFNNISIETIQCYMMGWLMNVVQQVKWDLAGENMPQCHFIHHKSHMFWPVTEPRSPWWEASDWAMVWLQACIMHTTTTWISQPYEMWQLCYNKGRILEDTHTHTHTRKVTGVNMRSCKISNSWCFLRYLSTIPYAAVKVHVQTHNFSVGWPWWKSNVVPWTNKQFDTWLEKPWLTFHFNKRWPDFDKYGYSRSDLFV
jgi:hypothetical protein